MATTSSGLRPVAAQRTEKQRVSITRSLNNGQKPPPFPLNQPSKRSVTPNSRSRDFDDDNDPGRVRVAVRIRPRNAEDLLSDADFADCVELHPELKRLKLRKNNWNSESYKFDEVFTATASQKRVYEVVAKPVVESVLSGYNGTIMAYGQTGTGKTFTLGRLGKNDASERGIMVRAVEDIVGNVSVASDTVEVSYLQLYMESIQDLLAPEKTNIPINEDPKTGKVSLPGALTVKVRDLDHFLELLQIGEANRHAANTKLNTESSRSHAILMVNIRRSVPEKVEDNVNSQDTKTKNNFPLVRKSKLLIVDLAGSERIAKSGSEGVLLEEAKFINLSLTSLGKCINALAENSPHIPTRDSKLTRLLRDSFGGSARTSLIVTVGPSSRYHAETTSTIMFGQRAMRIVNMVKLKEEFDYESLCRKLETQVDHLTAEIDRQQKSREKDKYDWEKQQRECGESFNETKKNLVARSEFLEKEKTRLELDVKDILAELKWQKDHNSLLQNKIADLEMSLKQTKLEVERTKSESVEQQLNATKKISDDHQISIQNSLGDITRMYEKKIMELTKQLEDERPRFEGAREQLDSTNMSLKDDQNSTQGKEEIGELRLKLEGMHRLHESTVNELQTLKAEFKDQIQEKEAISEKLYDVQEKLSVEEKRRKTIENEMVKLKLCASVGDKDFEDKRPYMKENIRGSTVFGTSASLNKLGTLRATQSAQRATIAKICEEVGLQKIIELLTSDDTDVQIHAVKVIANLAAEDTNQEMIVEEGGLDGLLTMLRSSQSATILRVASGAIANLAMNEMNQGLIMSRGGAKLLAKTASQSDDPQTLRMVAGALANLCGNEKLHTMLKEDGGIKALLGMVKSGNSDVVAQVARGLANFAKCESRATVQGHRKGRSLLMEDCSLEWLIANCNSASASTRRHVELALCHLAQNEDNAKDFISNGGLGELQRISMESSREDIRDLAKKILKSNTAFQGERRVGWLQ